MKPPAPRRPRGRASGDDRGDSARSSSSPRSSARKRNTGSAASPQEKPRRRPPLSGDEDDAAPHGSPSIRKGQRKQKRTESAGEVTRREPSLHPSSWIGPITRLTRPVGQSEAATILGGGEDAEHTEPASIQERRRERWKARWRLRITHVLVIVSVVALLIGGGWVVFFSPLFALDSSHIAVSGEDGKSLTDDMVASLLTPYVGTPITRLSMTDVEKTVTGNVLVRQAKASRKWPTGLSIAVTQRKAAMYTPVESGVTLIDEDGVDFSTADAAPTGIPAVSLAQGEDRPYAAKNVIIVWGSCDESLKSLVSLIESDGSQLTLTLTSGAKVAWGTVEDSPLKAQVLSVLVNQRDASVYDVSSPAHPVTS
ncbi:FtsQ-type POTRA domain-containing protein [Schaalia sp. ZJ405]|uniref:cell division protein FtsQ/DivIB n=1 Tax=Schaalia sp. ZJ405 TaxID=2709403 RepID=UPI0013EBFECE|nr:FtsQ-type POTRA domain-containing protein [Schaalia sp. ZJ405]QPK81871.1 FtsQ-type POTRA domain-containing protein [Schaalia sp. ZJ405]